jgi:plastocyanin
MSPRRRCLFALLPAVALAACGGGGGGGSSSSPTVPANPNLTVIAEEIHYDKKEYSVPTGEVRVEFDNQGTQTHNLIVQDPKGDRIDPKIQDGPGKKTGGVYQLGPGKYTLFCDITGHRDAGMVASLTVTP